MRLLYLFRIPRCQKARERMNRGQTGVASRDTILSRRFKVIQKEKDIASPKVVEFEIDHATVVVRGKKAKQQHECVPITQHRSGTEAAGERQMFVRRTRGEPSQT